VGLAESNGSLYCRVYGFMTHVTCRLTDKNRDHLRNPTLGNRVWASFTFLLYLLARCSPTFVGCVLQERAAAQHYHGWRRGIVVSGVRRMNEVNARRARG